MEKLGIGSLTRKVRKLEKISSIELSKKVDIDSTTLTKIETGKIDNPAFKTVIKLIEILSGYSAIKDRKIDLSLYDDDIVKLIWLNIDDSQIKEEFATNANDQLKPFFGNLSYITESDFEAINAIAIGKHYLFKLNESVKLLRNKLDGLIARGDIIEYSDINFTNMLFKTSLDTKGLVDNAVWSSIFDGINDETIELLPSIINSMVNNFDEYFEYLKEDLFV